MSERFLMRVACAATAVLLVALLLHGLDVVRRMETIADFVSPLVMAHDAHLYPGSQVVFGNYGWYSGFVGAAALGVLPAGDQLAAVAPILLTLLIIGLLALQAYRIWNLSAAVVLAATALAMGGEEWVAAASWSVHWSTWWCAALAALAITAEIRGRRRQALIAGAVTALWVGMCLPGDNLAYAAVFPPLLAVTALAAFRRAWPLALEGIAFAVVILASGRLFAAIYAANGFVKHDFPFDSVSFWGLGSYAGQTMSGVTQLWAPFGSANYSAAFAYLGAGMLVAAAAAVPTVLKDQRDLGPAAWTVFWLVAGLSMVGAFILNTSSVLGGVPVVRYLYGLPLVAASLLAAAAGGGHGRRLALAAAGVLAAGAAYGFFADPPERQPVEHAPARANVQAAVRRYHLARGYASYNTAYAMERASRFQLRLLPAKGCSSQPGVCPFYLHRFDAAYRPQPGTRTFILLDHSALVPPGGDFGWLTAEPAGVTPVRRFDVGDGLEMLIYDHDVARDFGPLPGLDGT